MAERYSPFKSTNKSTVVSKAAANTEIWLRDEVIENLEKQNQRALAELYDTKRQAQTESEYDKAMIDELERDLKYRREMAERDRLIVNALIGHKED